MGGIVSTGTYAARREGDALNDLLVIRILFIAVLSCAAYFLKPFSLDGPIAAAVGAAAALRVVFFEIRIKRSASRD